MDFSVEDDPRGQIGPLVSFHGPNMRTKPFFKGPWPQHVVVGGGDIWAMFQALVNKRVCGVIFLYFLNIFLAAKICMRLLGYNFILFFPFKELELPVICGNFSNRLIQSFTADDSSRAHWDTQGHPNSHRGGFQRRQQRRRVRKQARSPAAPEGQAWLITKHPFFCLPDFSLIARLATRDMCVIARSGLEVHRLRYASKWIVVVAGEFTDWFFLTKPASEFFDVPEFYA